MFTKEQLAQWREQDFVFDDFYDNAAVVEAKKELAIKYNSSKIEDALYLITVSVYHKYLKSRNGFVNLMDTVTQNTIATIPLQFNDTGFSTQLKFPKLDLFSTVKKAKVVLYCDEIQAETNSFKLEFEKEEKKENNSKGEKGIKDGWYKDDMGKYNYFDGKVDKDKFKNQIYLGNYLVIADEKYNFIKFKYKNIWEDSIDLDSDIGYKFRMVIAESNFKTEKAEIIENKKEKEAKQKDKIIVASIYELYIISASIDNRKKIGKKFFGDTYRNVVEQEGQYDGTNSSVYKNFIETLNTKWWAGKNWYDEYSVMEYLGRVYQAVVHEPESEHCAVNILKTHYDLNDADYILAYTHNGKYIFEPYSYHIDFDKSKCWIKTVESSTNAFPELK
ncbi:hypothetical protein [Chryseobacterium luteum]|uniref:Uncharacterized protein n=1 Tax=Chryseobacterium luteum TaxID=421531 RepID=A0A085YZM8_9FLAO|nr:hypothetical protein [Chryseobacterium luteum]KFE97641.1 hypothetical protein IX38_20480 [Chryseobacterium luteum]